MKYIKYGNKIKGLFFCCKLAFSLKAKGQSLFHLTHLTCAEGFEPSTF